MRKYPETIYIKHPAKNVREWLLMYGDRSLTDVRIDEKGKYIELVAEDRGINKVYLPAKFQK